MTENAPARPMTAEDVVKRIVAECAFIGANGEVGIRRSEARSSVSLVNAVTGKSTRSTSGQTRFRALHIHSF
jgi:hypothetical protein